ncbi:MAG: hypothetical protein R3B07_21790 [Polyangiaceae bacterium]
MEEAAPAGSDLPDGGFALLPSSSAYVMRYFGVLLYNTWDGVRACQFGVGSRKVLCAGLSRAAAARRRRVLVEEARSVRAERDVRSPRAPWG